MPTADSSNPHGMSSLPSQRRSRGEDAYPAPCHRRDSIPEDYHSISGWGADLDTANRPMVPKELPSDVDTVRGNVVYRQTPMETVFISNEMPDLTPVFGTACPPHGLSGVIRRLAFEYGEGKARHWLALMFADRIDMIESTVGSALRGQPDNIIREKAWVTRLTGGDPKRRRRLALVGGAIAIVAYRNIVPMLAARRTMIR